jgi:hypothetical protein
MAIKEYLQDLIGASEFDLIAAAAGMKRRPQLRTKPVLPV